MGLGVIKACAQHDTAWAGESCHPGRVLPQILEGHAHPMVSHWTVPAEPAAHQGFSRHVGPRSLPGLGVDLERGRTDTGAWAPFCQLSEVLLSVRYCPQ